MISNHVLEKERQKEILYDMSFLFNEIINKRVSLSSIFFTMLCHETLRNACSVTHEPQAFAG